MNKLQTNITEDCIWYNSGYCAKSLPGIECDITKCVAYSPKNEKK